MTTTNNTIDKTIVAFHIGRGGRFYNGGHKTLIGFKDFQDLISMNDSNLIIRHRDAEGKFCKPYIVNLSGNEVSDDDVNGLTGSLNFDNDYDTKYAMYLDDCSEAEHELVYKSAITPDEVKQWIVEQYTDPNSQYIIVDWIDVEKEQEAN